MKKSDIKAAKRMFKKAKNKKAKKEMGKAISKILKKKKRKKRENKMDYGNSFKNWYSKNFGAKSMSDAMVC